MDTIGQKMLKDKLLTQSGLARRVGVSPQAVSRWVAGLDRPEPEHREAIQREIGIPAEAWSTDEERRQTSQPA